jgi:glycosyltransferase involved in cell wall biosynthesis
MAIELSVICPTFNRADHLVNHLVSLGSQTFPHDQFESLIIDDGSTDHTFPVVREARRLFDFPIRYIYLPRPEKNPPTVAWNVGIRQARADILVQAGPDTIMAKDALELHYAYQTMGADHLYVFGRCYRIHTPFAQSRLKYVDWTENFRLLETLFITEYHHSTYWSVPYLASIQRKWFEQIRGYDESWPEFWPDDSDMDVRLWAIGVETFNAPDIFGAHQWHEENDMVCTPDCGCPLVTKDKTQPGPDLKYNGTPEDLVRNPEHWGEVPGMEEL